MKRELRARHCARPAEDGDKYTDELNGLKKKPASSLTSATQERELWTTAPVGIMNGGRKKFFLFTWSFGSYDFLDRLLTFSFLILHPFRGHTHSILLLLFFVTATQGNQSLGALFLFFFLSLDMEVGMLE